MPSTTRHRLTTTQIGALAENIVSNELMKFSGGRLTPFAPLADDDGIDVLIFDKNTGKAIPIQVKARTITLKKTGSQERGNTVYFQVRKATFKAKRHAYFLGVLLNSDLNAVERAWLMSMRDLKKVATERPEKYVVRPSRQLNSKDRCSPYQCRSLAEVTKRLLAVLDKK